MYLRHRKKNKREHAGPIEYLLIFVLIIMLTTGLFSSKGPHHNRGHAGVSSHFQIWTDLH